MKNHHVLIIIVILLFIAVFGVGFLLLQPASGSIQKKETPAQQTTPQVDEIEQTVPVATQPKEQVTHIATPTHVRALYMSSWVASGTTMRNKIIQLIDDTNLNAVIIDIKDDTGRVSFMINNDVVQKTGSPVARIADIDTLIKTLHDKNIYVIGRIAVFQDPYLTHAYPEWAINKKSDGSIWKDRKGLSFLDPTKKPVWDYITNLAIGSYETGFDEINFDYVRFPSDGNIQDISYPTDGNLTRADHIENFFAYLNNQLRTERNIPTSADLFGMTTTNTDDLGIGQVLVRALPYFDYIAPMIYPSHYPKNFHNFANPAAHPGEIVTIAMQGGIDQAKTLNMEPSVFRPWIQDFNMGAQYGITEVRAQINALEKLGIHSYMVWDPGNSYTVGAYDKE